MKRLNFKFGAASVFSIALLIALIILSGCSKLNDADGAVPPGQTGPSAPPSITPPLYPPPSS